ncbi:MAG TPA: hypothetical protein VD815_01090 [Candidatus Saccharimonadales bacterium]|nr:hypothetical protein [Candidatus Saccharimonadales bacterium]
MKASVPTNFKFASTMGHEPSFINVLAKNSYNPQNTITTMYTPPPLLL